MAKKSREANVIIQEMKNTILFVTVALVGFSCATRLKKSPKSAASIIGTWQLLSGTTIKGVDTTIVDYTQGQKMIKIITPTHFAFMRHDLNHGKDSSAVFVAGGGTVTITPNTYTEYLEYLNYREWEGTRFDFAYRINGDTLVTTGVEKVESLGVDHLNIEKYSRVR